MSRTSAAFSAAAAWLVFTVAGAAWACPPPRCYGGWFFPPVPGASPEEVAVPANIGGVVLQPLYDGAVPSSLPPSSFGLRRVDGTAPGEVAVRSARFDDAHLLIPTTPLAAGGLYEVVAPDLCMTPSGPPPDPMPRQARFRTAAAAVVPTSVGRLRAQPAARGSLAVASISGSCTGLVDAVSVDVVVELSDEAAAWSHALWFETWVDGVRWSPRMSLPLAPAPGASWVGRGKDRLYRTCATADPGAERGLAEGAHRVVIRARVPGHDRTLETPALDVELRCGAGSSPDGGGTTVDAAPAARDGAAPPDAGAVIADGGSSDSTADRPLDLVGEVGADRAGGENGVSPAGTGGCGCTTGSGSGGVGAAPTVVVVALAWRARARRRRAGRQRRPAL